MSWLSCHVFWGQNRTISVFFGLSEQWGNTLQPGRRKTTANANITCTAYFQKCNICCTLSLFSCPSERPVCWRYIVCVSCWPSDSTSIEKHWTAGPRVYTVPLPHTRTHTHTTRILHTQLQCRWSNRPLFTCLLLLAEFGVWAWLWACTCTDVRSDTIKPVARMCGQSGRSAVARRSRCIGIKYDTEANSGWGPQTRRLAAVSITGIRQTQSATTTKCNNNAFIYLHLNSNQTQLKCVNRAETEQHTQFWCC